MPYLLAAFVVLIILAVLAGCGNRGKPSGWTSGQPPRVGAMCYTPAPPAPTAQFLCPKCGQKTLYAYPGYSQGIQQPDVIPWLESLLPACRQAAKDIAGLPLELDESQFCKQCNPGVAKPQLVLVIRYPDRPEPHRVIGIALDDLRLLKAYQEGNWLQQHQPRLEQLLGVKLDAKPGVKANE